MRARKRKHTPERIMECKDWLIEDPTLFKGKWRELAKKPIALEIGCGKGAFICELAKRNPDKFYIAMEKIADVIVLALEKAKADNIENLVFISGDAKNLPDYFEKGEISLIYLNFSDPWPKKGHAKRRLTSPVFLPIYKEILPKDGALYFKTDNAGLFEYSLLTFTEANWTLKNVTRDLHASEFNADNIMTEYEKTFSEKGFKINRLEAYPN